MDPSTATWYWGLARMPLLRTPGFRKFAAVFGRIALASLFLSSVADRFGAWGRYGTPHVAWGDFQHFLAYAETLMPFLPKLVVVILAWFATVLEGFCGLALLVGVKTRPVAAVSGALLVLFGLAMTMSPAGLHGAIASSVFGAASAGLLLAAVTE
ncbi:MAG TPA: DoxX family membrane protein [Polyangiaceae bacterium]|nr:DoxX family membrane protein [Polyangiaceae bacterium]